ncbi:ROK family protein [Tetragenococcus koreensis]|uniref:ROK family protein n=1 Tax=Tetragenococcus koreensis TaxID=290335 RepID=UPI001F458D8F|nr:ROK family protein [Tetragenococcus koreensis]MCF1620489.1 ROK family protein [Tetragenococcus koreensis]MCF1657979.1 ROK family protein [Tetragenococcus koreensis]
MGILALDIGGTAIKYGVYNFSTGTFERIYEKTTPKSKTTNLIMESVKQIIEEMTDDDKIEGIAVSTAGVVDPKKGTVVFAGPTIPGYTNTPIKQIIENQFNIPCEVENDVNCAALGELWKGAGKESSSLVCTTIGTGVGGSVILDGKLWHGASYSAGELGYLPVASGRTLQEEASTTALVANYSARTNIQKEKLNGKIIFKKARSGEEAAIEAIDDMLTSLIQGLLAVTYLISPETIVIGGGIAAQKDYLESKIKAKLEQSIISERMLPKTIVCAELGNTAGMTGAIYHFTKIHPDRHYTV